MLLIENKNTFCIRTLNRVSNYYYEININSPLLKFKKFKISKPYKKINNK